MTPSAPRIVYDHQVFAWQEYGGISRYFVELATGLSRAREFDVTLLALAHVNAHLGDSEPGLVTGWRVPNTATARTWLSRIDSVAARVWLATHRPAIVHETYYSRWRLAPARARVVVTVFDMTHEKFPGEFSPGDKTSRNKALAVARADHVICISENTRKDLIEHLGVPPERTSVTHLGYRLTTTAVPELPSRAAGPYLLYVGQRGGYKNFGRLLEAYARSPLLKDHLELVCFGGGVFSAPERAAMERLAVSPRVTHVMGGDGVLAGLYGRASALVYPSLYEGFGIPPLEAMAFRCPVVCSDCSSLPEVAGTAAQYFDPFDVDSIRLAVEQVVDRPTLAASLVERGLERIKRFSWERCVRETQAIYHSLL
jgi:glycosyltransferase involved in cell wall biosynthesis